MRLFRVAHRGARVGICVLALGCAGVAAQDAPTSTEAGSAPVTASDAQPANKADTVKPEDSSGQSSPTPAGTSELPELVVDGKKDDKKKKSAKSKEKVDTATSTSDVSVTEPPPGVVLGTSAPSDTGTSTFDANAVQMRTNGGGDANTFLRNLPNVQYQNNASTNAGANSATAIDTKPALMSISGGRTYENNFILNGVSISNITGPQDYAASNMLGDNDSPDPHNIYGMSPQSIYVPAEFIGTATVISSNASAEYGQFQGGVVRYDLVAPPTDRYQASVSASHESSDYASYILATPDGKNSQNVAAPTYDKTKLAVSVGAPITKDFAFIAQASRLEANSSKPRAFPMIGGQADVNSDNTFMRFAATARTDVGKFTFDTSNTKYFQHWEYYKGYNMNLDTNTTGSSNKLEYETKLAGVRLDSVGLGNVRLVTRASYNTNETQNNSDDDTSLLWYKQSLKKNKDPVTQQYYWTQNYISSGVAQGWCDTANLATYPVTGFTTVTCNEGGYGNQLQGQTDYGVDATLSGAVLLGSFKVGADFKEYEGHRARLEDFTSGQSPFVITDSGQVYNAAFGSVAQSVQTGKFICKSGDRLCSENEFFWQAIVSPKYDITATLDSFHTFAEIDQTWKWFNVRAGVRLDYDDYFENINIAPRVAGTFMPIKGLSFTGGVNRYYLGESLYYAIRDRMPNSLTYQRGSGTTKTTPGYNTTTGEVDDLVLTKSLSPYMYSTSGLRTPYSNEYTGAVALRDPLFGGNVRLGYLERYNEDQFATTSCGTGCYTASNDGSSFYRSATAEYTKQWSGLRNSILLDAAAITGNVTWSEQKTGHTTYLLSSDLNGDGTAETKRVSYNGVSYASDEFVAITGNLDIPVRIGATLSSIWFNDRLELNATAGVNLGYQGVYDTGISDYTTSGCQGGYGCSVYLDKKFGATLKLGLNGRINIDERAAIDFQIDNLTNSTGNSVASSLNPWVLGRTFWIGSTVKLQ